MISVNIATLVLLWITIVNSSPLAQKSQSVANSETDQLGDDIAIPITGATLKKILQYNRLQQLADVDYAPEDDSRLLNRIPSRSYPNVYLNSRNIKRAGK